ncbi:MAG: hypothetical protein GY795_12395 [Desulfobacterales bacterium]|nr:hypothetical protein [Desulfobacterales bacterium]
MKKLTVFFILICMTNNYTYAKEKSFFSESVKTDMKTDLNGFLRKLPQNKGQQQQIRRLLQYSEYKEILLFTDTSFSPEILKKLSGLKKPFLLMSALDILSYNQKRSESFSSWYLSELAVLVKNRPEIYMAPFLRFCQKSDGEYSELLALPLTELIGIHIKDFSASMQTAGDAEKLCGILKTGDGRLISKNLKTLISFNKTNYSSRVGELITCLNNK